MQSLPQKREAFFGPVLFENCNSADSVKCRAKMINGLLKLTKYFLTKK